jgi:hypothetical protein
MPSLFSHVFIAVSILLIFSKELKLDPRKILILSFFAVLPDASTYSASTLYSGEK